MTKKQRIHITGSGEVRAITRGKKYRIRHRIPKEANGGVYGWSPMRTVYGTIADARVALEEYRLELEAEINGDLVDQTFADYANAFHQHRVDAGVLAQSTLDRERYQIKRICEILGKMDIGGITLADVNAAYDKLRQQGISQAGINSFHRKLNQIMSKALKEEVIPRNPCLLVELSEVRRPRKTVKKTLSVQQFRELAQALLEMETDGKVIALWIAMSTGARKGEVLGLTWEDVDLDAAKIGFNAQLTANKKRIPQLKNETSHRTRAIDVNTVNFLTNWWRAQSVLFYGGKAVPLGAPVCCDDSGGFMRTSAFDKWRRRLFADHGLGKFKTVEKHVDRHGRTRYKYTGYTGFRLHDLRHAQATFLASQNVDVKTIQERGGWASADVPMNIYAKYVAENDKTAADAISKLMPIVSLKPGECIAAGRFGRFGGAEDGAQSSDARPRDLLVETHRHRAVPIQAEVAQKKVLDCFEDEPEGTLLSKKDIVARTGIFSAKCMSKTLVALQGSGKIERVGSTKAAKYRKAS